MLEALEKVICLPCTSVMLPFSDDLFSGAGFVIVGLCVVAFILLLAGVLTRRKK